MTKSEAKAIYEGTTRVVQSLEGVRAPKGSATPIEWYKLDEGVRAQVYAAHRELLDEVHRIRDMAVAELGLK